MNRRPVVRQSYTVSVYKDWNFDKGETAPLPYVGIDYEFTPLATLHEVGHSREFAVVGQSRELLYTR